MSGPAECEFRHLLRVRFVRVRYQDWNPGGEGTIVCVHGLTQNRLHFEPLAVRLAHHHRVIVVDLPGRGESDRLENPADYAMPCYEAILSALIARIGRAEVDWIGISLGGLLGIRLAAADASPIRRLVLNDIGPFVPRAGRVEVYGADPHFADLDAAILWHKRQRAEIGPMAEADWARVTAWSLVPDGAGFHLHADPAIWANRDPATTGDTDLWAEWDRIHQPTLVIWGTESRLLRASEIEGMKARGPRAEVHEVPGVGHPPPFIAEDILARAEVFLDRGEAF